MTRATIAGLIGILGCVLVWRGLAPKSAKTVPVVSQKRSIVKKAEDAGLQMVSSPVGELKDVKELSQPETSKAPAVDETTQKQIDTMLHQVANDFNSGDLDKAINSLQEILRLNPNNTFAMQALGMAYWRKGESNRALEQFQIVLEKNPSDYLALEKMTDILHSSGQQVKAEQLLTEQAAQHPESVAAASVLGSYLISQNRLNEAIPVLENAYSRAPQPKGILVQELGGALMANNNLDQAQNLFERHLRELEQIDKSGKLSAEQKKNLHAEINQTRVDLAQSMISQRNCDGAQKTLDALAKEDAAIKRSPIWYDYKAECPN